MGLVDTADGVTKAPSKSSIREEGSGGVIQRRLAPRGRAPAELSSAVIGANDAESI